jgi:hypothetical protein
MKSIIFFLLFALITGTQLQAQSAPSEVFAGPRSTLFQQVINANLTETKWGYFRTASLQKNSWEQNQMEIMNQDYITYSFFPFLKLAAGTFYATVPGLSPSLALQFMKVGNYHFFLIVPRIDIQKQGSYDLFTLVELRSPLIQKYRLYARLQNMLNFSGLLHNRSYLQFRIGIERMAIKMGIGINWDAYGNEVQVQRSLGLFLKYDLLHKTERQAIND